jgi:hypothetical protein
MAFRKNRDGHFVIGAINADFFSANGEPTNNQVVNSEIVRGVASNRTQFALTKKKKPLLGKYNFSGTVITKNNLARPINSVNQARGTDFLVLYNHFVGPTTGTNQAGVEVELLPLSAWSLNDTLRFVANNMVDSVGSMAIPQDGAVLSGNGVARKFIDTNISVGDTIALVLRYNADPDAVTQLVGGVPRLIMDSTDVSIESGGQEGASSSFATDRHPRTAIGMCHDSTKLYLITVDGRQLSSIGVSLPELSGLMLSLGIYQGVNLDGGGSTTMVVNGGIVNSPSDATGERPVANAVLVVSSNLSTQVAGSKSKPDGFLLHQNFPNPFNAQTVIEYSIPTGRYVTLKVYDVLGREIETLINGRTEAGLHRVEFDGSGSPSGVYYYCLFCADLVETRNMILAK